MSNKPSIPAWQRPSTESSSSLPPSQQAAAEQPVEIEAPTPTEDDEQPPVEAPTPTEDDIADASGEDAHTESTILVEQASRFLDDPTIRDAPREKKVAFLQAKGVKAEDIKTLLGTATKENAVAEMEEFGQRTWSTTPPKPASIPESRPQPREIPPIVTYPEFLAQTEKPPPLITTRRLLATAYMTGGLMASIYGLSKYIIAPMTQNLAEARHDYAEHTQAQLKELNEKLGKAVSVDPASKTKTIIDIGDDISEADSDPTELYHRDYGTQTTPTLSRRPSTSSPSDPHPTITAQENRLKIIKSHLKELESNRTSYGTSKDSLRTKVSDLSTYLSEMSYQNQYHSNMGFYGSSYTMPGSKDGKNDQIEVLKNDIRAVKGVFLSARNFPAGGGVR
ncbi:hypothetical protein ACN47E_005908 [Coniothyrium glycines]